MISITKPGIYPGVTAEQYHKDPVETPSLSSTIAKLLFGRSPRHAWYAHPKLGGAKDDSDEETADPSASKAKALGELIHRLVIGKGGDVVVIDADSYRTTAAKAQRDAALFSGQIPVLAHKLPEAQAAANAARQQLDDMGFDYAYREGMREVVIVWEENGVWFRVMVDQLLIDENSKMATIRDLKTVGRSSHPKACGKQISDLGYDFSLAFYKRGIAAVRPDLAGRIKCEWDFLEVNAPYALTPVSISGEWEMAADARVEKAIAKWRECMTSNRWPFYTESTVRLEPNPWDIAEAFTEE